jgi:hypothetical protein
MVLIAKSEFVGALQKRLEGDPTAHIFADSDSLAALEVILAQRPKVVALDLAFATTSRGAALIARVKADPLLAAVDVRLLSEDETKLPVLLGHSAASIDVAMATGSRPLDRCGTRRAPRFRMKPDAEIVVNGESSRLVNLSTTGAQILCPLRLQPEQTVRLLLTDGTTETRLRARVAWSSLEVTGGAIKYRAGVDFADPAVQRIEEYCLRHATSLEHAFIPS